MSGRASTASAQATPPPPVVFTAVDAFSYDPYACRFTVRGVVDGDPAASDRTFAYTCESTTNPNYELRRRLESCERLALLAMAKPGQHVFQVTPYVNYYFPACKLTRVNP
ncbi:hypothetical protein AMYX_22880 [Anaeromyxobacter diazotrophicus]|uniref:Uncharacterized protein n=1 Tax=Anaeromyxobacter diazotrophicus TaxID=2590199 RepID=A0A7I9VNJ1_9BACT|nr:hypothetical protein AMYX_22880 [Anaeromyxobacter diazotrophicus]